MKNYVSEYRKKYEDYHQGQFSKKLAEWAIGNMKPLTPKSYEETMAIFKTNGVKIDEDMTYTAWYLYNMALADYPKSLTTDEARTLFVKETLTDPDGSPKSVLECFTAKMCCVGKPIHWEKYL